MNDAGTDISVALTATRFIAASTFEDDHQRMLWKGNIPICVAEMGLLMFGMGPDQEAFEHRYSMVCKEMAKKVAVDVHAKTLFIGEDPSDENTGLVVYTEQRDTDYTREFFKRWSETRMMVFQYHLKGLNGPIFSLGGLWDKDGWTTLEIGHRGTFHIA